jgi:hypothetical protein
LVSANSVQVSDQSNTYGMSLKIKKKFLTSGQGSKLMMVFSDKMEGRKTHLRNLVE